MRKSFTEVQWIFRHLRQRYGKLLRQEIQRHQCFLHTVQQQLLHAAYLRDNSIRDNSFLAPPQICMMDEVGTVVAHHKDPDMPRHHSCMYIAQHSRSSIDRREQKWSYPLCNPSLKPQCQSVVLFHWKTEQ